MRLRKHGFKKILFPCGWGRKMLLPFHHLDDTDAAICCATVKFQWNFWMLRDQRLKPQPSSDLKFQLLA